MSQVLPIVVGRAEPGSAEWWRDRLLSDLAARQATYRQLNDYFEGNHPLAFTSKQFLEAFGGLFQAFADNWCELVVDAVEERLNVEGFRLGGDQDERGDRDAWRIWQSNQLDADSEIGHVEALVFSRCPVLVSPLEDDFVADGVPAITVESPQQMIVAYEPGSRRRRAAALKRWTGDDGEQVTLYLPDGIYKWQGVGPGTGTTRWEPRRPAGEEWPVPNPLDVVPVVELQNRPRLAGQCRSEIANVMPVQDAINKIVADVLVASEYAAFPQRILVGWEPPVDPETSQVVEGWQPKAAVSRFWYSEDPETKWGQFDAADLSNYVAVIEMFVQHMASQTRTPPHYFYLRGQFPSGEAIKSAETGLVAKARRKMRHFGETWEEVIRLAFAVVGDQREGVPDAETIWGDPESRSEAEHVDAVLKMKAMGVPNMALWEQLGFSPPQIERFERAQSREALLNQAVDLASFAAVPVSSNGGGG